MALHRIGHVELKKSQAAHGGQGVFATTNYKPNELITEYMGVFRPQGLGGDSRYILEVNVQKNKLKYIPYYGGRWRTTLDYYGCETASTSQGYGAFINDLEYSLLNQQYVRNGGNRSNVRFVMYRYHEHKIPEIQNKSVVSGYPVDIRVFAVATRNIDEGEELSVSYGSNYWSTLNETGQDEGTHSIL